MIVCQRCNKENQPHYKFCLGCGAELSVPSVPIPAPQGVGGPGAGQNSMGMMKTMMADQSGAYPVQPQHVAPMPSGPGAAKPAPAAGQAPMSRAKICTTCGTEIPPNFKFCGGCGAAVANVGAPVAVPQPAVPHVAAAPAPAATMTLIRPDGSEGGHHYLSRGKNHIGRNHGGLFENDGYLSPTHAEIKVHEGHAVVKDLDSLNGVFVRMTEEEELRPGQILRIGQELLRFDLINAAETDDEGTEIMGSPNPGFWGRIVVVIGDGADGSAYPLLNESVSLGRERGDINFPDDGYVSGLHARISARNGKVYLADMGSSNGTFIKVAGERPLGQNSFVLLGQQLFRMNFPN